jgi:hypothetical protein
MQCKAIYDYIVTVASYKPTVATGLIALLRHEFGEVITSVQWQHVSQLLITQGHVAAGLLCASYTSHWKWSELWLKLLTSTNDSDQRSGQQLHAFLLISIIY